MKKFHPFLLSLASGLLLSGAWPPLPTIILIFFAFVPLFYLLEQGVSRKAFLGWSFLSMLIWNTITTWWIWNSTDVGAIGAIITNAALMTLPWLALYNVNKRLGSRFAYPAFLSAWLSFEYIHLNWELSWPWLTLGNVFANNPDWVQWYEYTGTSGGSLWVLIVNILILKSVKAAASRTDLTGNRRSPKLKISLAVALVLPIATSFLIKFTRNIGSPEDNKSATSKQPNIVVVQPNIDPYAKFSPGTQEAQLNQLIRLSESAIDNETALVVWPETAINSPNGIEENKINQNASLQAVRDFLGRHPQLKLLSGVESFNFLSSRDESPYARPIYGTDMFYEAYNTAALFDSSGMISKYHKSKLVPGVETLPSFLRFMDQWFEHFGGTTGGYARQEERTVLTDDKNGLKIAPAICYESIYGDFMTGFFRNGANIMIIITNDGWWGNTAGHKQHLAYARLRAIETRRWVVRSANTGISCFIDPLGKIYQPQGWDTEAAIKQAVQTYEEQTFFVRFGDWISWIMIIAAAGILSWSTFRFVQSRYQSKTNKT